MPRKANKTTPGSWIVTKCLKKIETRAIKTAKICPIAGRRLKILFDGLRPNNSLMYGLTRSVSMESSPVCRRLSRIQCPPHEINHIIDQRRI
jgi:hypothetical protein